MSDTEPGPVGVPSLSRPSRDPGSDPASQDRVLQVERLDYVDLAPVGRERVQPLRGFDPIYTDIVDYIVRCTHRIWDERDVGLIYSHYTHNCVVYGPVGTVYNREDVVRDTVQRLVELPDRRGMATQVIWRGNEDEGFYTSHLVTGSGRHTEPGLFGKPTNRSFHHRTIADCMIFENRIFREWVVRDSMSIALQLGCDKDELATIMARGYVAKGFTAHEIAENGRLLGQYPPEETADVSLAHTETEAWTLRWMHEVYNRRMFGRIREVYAPNVQWHGPPMKELYGRHAVMMQTMRLVNTVPDCVLIPQHICSVPCVEGGEKVAVRWVLDGHHQNLGLTLGAPTGHRVWVLGMSHFHVVDGKIKDEWAVWDELALLTQIKIGEMTK